MREFSDKGHLDEQKFAQWLIDLLKRRGKSNRAIRAELYKKGISRELADEAVTGGGEDETKRLKQLIAKKRQLPRYQNDPQKLKQYLARQGFGFDQINDVLKNT